MNTLIPELQLIDAPINFPQWIADQYAKATPAHQGRHVYVKCPVCGDVLSREAYSSRGVLQALSAHLASDIPIGLQFLNYRPGDQVCVAGEQYEVISGPRRFQVGGYGTEKRHQFFLVLKRRRDGKIFRNTRKAPAQLQEYRGVY